MVADKVLGETEGEFICEAKELLKGVFSWNKDGEVIEVHTYSHDCIKEANTGVADTED